MQHKKMSYRFSENARTDLLSIMHYISFTLSNPFSAEKLRLSFQKSINLLLEFPELHPVEFKLKFEYRKLVVANYNVFYVLDNNEIITARILHNRQNFKKHIKKSQSLN